MQSIFDNRHRRLIRSPLSTATLWALITLEFIFSGARCLAQSADESKPANQTIALAEKYALNLPSDMTPRALSGLFTSVTRAGSRLVAVGERGHIIISDDNGITWRQTASPTSVTLTKVAFATAQDGWIVGNMGLVLYTKDGGLQWTKQLDGAEAANIALRAARENIKENGSNDDTARQLRAAQLMVSAGSSTPFLDVEIIARSQLIIAGAFGMAYMSVDGGKTWQYIANFMPNQEGLHIYQILDRNDDLTVVGEQGLVLCGPLNKPMTIIDTPFQGTFFGELFAPDRSWLLFGLQGTVLRSTDKGKHWMTIAAGTAAGIDAGIVLKNGMILLANTAGQLLTSIDSGRNFKVIVTGEPIVGLAQASDGSVVLVGPTGPRRFEVEKPALGVEHVYE